MQLHRQLPAALLIPDGLPVPHHSLLPSPDLYQLPVQLFVPLHRLLAVHQSRLLEGKVEGDAMPVPLRVCKDAVAVEEDGFELRCQPRYLHAPSTRHFGVRSSERSSERSRREEGEGGGKLRRQSAEQDESGECT
eukprot:748779-Hanusia_phi.AAC.2